MRLSKPLQKAVKHQVISQAEAEEIQSLCQKARQEEVKLPKHLFPAAERLYLWERPTVGGMH